MSIKNSIGNLLSIPCMGKQTTFTAMLSNGEFVKNVSPMPYRKFKRYCYKRISSDNIESATILTNGNIIGTVLNLNSH